MPVWVEGDAQDIGKLIGKERQFDMILSCPPYLDLEKYSDNPKDLSNMSDAAFRKAYASIIKQAVQCLKDDRFIVWVVGEVREKKQGYYRNFVPDTILAFEQAGARYYNEAVLVTMVGSLPLRTGRAMQASRKLGKTHQNVLVFVKGDPVKAAQACGQIEFKTEDAEG